MTFGGLSNDTTLMHIQSRRTVPLDEIKWTVPYGTRKPLPGLKSYPRVCAPY